MMVCYALQGTWLHNTHTLPDVVSHSLDVKAMLLRLRQDNSPSFWKQRMEAYFTHKKVYVMTPDADFVEKEKEQEDAVLRDLREVGGGAG